MLLLLCKFICFLHSFSFPSRSFCFRSQNCSFWQASNILYWDSCLRCWILRWVGFMCSQLSGFLLFWLVGIVIMDVRESLQAVRIRIFRRQWRRAVIAEPWEILGTSLVPSPRKALLVNKQQEQSMHYLHFLSIKTFKHFSVSLRKWYSVCDFVPGNSLPLWPKTNTCHRSIFNLPTMNYIYRQSRYGVRCIGIC